VQEENNGAVGLAELGVVQARTRRDPDACGSLGHEYAHAVPSNPVPFLARWRNSHKSSAMIEPPGSSSSINRYGLALRAIWLSAFIMPLPLCHSGAPIWDVLVKACYWPNVFRGFRATTDLLRFCFAFKSTPKARTTSRRRASRSTIAARGLLRAGVRHAEVRSR